MNYKRRLFATVVVFCLALVWREQVWLAVLSLILGNLVIWLPPARRLIWLSLTLLTLFMMAFFVYRPGGASNYTNDALSAIIALTLTGAVIELVMTKQTADEA